MERIDHEQGALHVLVNDIWGATTMEWNKTVWESSLDVGLRTLRLAIDTHAITAHFALPLLIRSPGGLVVEVTDGTSEYNAVNYRVSFFYDLAKAANLRMAFALAHELEPHGATAVALTPGWLRSEAMLEAYGVTESTWRDATKVSPHFAISESPAFVGRAVAALAADPGAARAGTGSRCRVASWPRSTASPTSTGASRTRGGTSPRSRTPASPPTPPATADVTATPAPTLRRSGPIATSACVLSQTGLVPRPNAAVAHDAESADAPRTGTQAIERAMSILRSFDDAPELGIVDLAHRLDLSPSTTHRIVRALVEARLLDQDPRTERYRLGVGLAELGLRTLQRLGVEAARPLLEDLAAETGESVNLGVRHGGEVLVVMRVASAPPLAGGAAGRQSCAGAHLGDGQGDAGVVPRPGRGGRRARSSSGVPRRGRSRRGRR